MKLITKSLLYIASACTLITVGCNKMEFNKIATGAWNPNLAVPLAYGNFDSYDIMARTDTSDLVVIDPNTGALALVYKSEAFSVDAASLVIIQDLSQSKSLALYDLNAIPAPAYSSSANSTNNETITFNAGGAEIHNVKFKSGVISLNVSTDLAHDVNCVVTFPEVLKNGTPISTTVSLNYSGSVPHSTTATIDLSGALADFTLGNTTFNKLNATIETSIDGSGQAINGSESVDLDFNFNSLLFQNASGYFGQNNLGISGDTVLIKLFQNSTEGYFELVNPKIRFMADNSFGFPIRINLSDLKSMNVANGTQHPLNGYPNVFNIASPNAMGQSINSIFELNTSNTANLSTVVSSVPKYFMYSANAQSNPDGNVPPLNFITDESQLTLRTEVELPLEGSAYGFEFKDTVDFNFNEDVSQLESVMFRLNVDNGFPVELKSQIVFLDENYNPVFTVFNTPESLVSSALVNSIGRVNQRTQKITDISLTSDQIQLLPNVKYILFNAISQSLNGPSGQVVKIYDDYTLNLKLGLQVQGKIQL